MRHAVSDSTPIPCRPLSLSGADTPVLVTAFAPLAFSNFTMIQFAARQRSLDAGCGGSLATIWLDVCYRCVAIQINNPA